MLPDTTNTDFQQAVAFVTRTNKSLFLTGKAGTGKTTFLKYIRENCYKKMAIVAPTGVAAINAGGVTIHSFFQLPFGLYVPAYPTAWDGTDSHIYNKHQLLGKMRMSSSKRDLIRELELLIIDEVSMLRADMLDAMDTVLRSVRRRHLEPFGGVQMLYIGDLFQLPPVIKKTEWSIYHEQYKTPFFFEAHAFREDPPVYLELKKIYRQNDPEFIDLLNQIRNNCCGERDFAKMQNYFQPGHTPPLEEGYITLTSHNFKADNINKVHLDSLSAKMQHFEAEIQGEFPEHSYPVPKILQLKEGAQIMFIKNDKGDGRKYYNGKIGIVQHIEKRQNKIFVFFPGEEGLLELSLETWRNIRYTYDTAKDDIIEEELGTFTQYPVRLAWAITIHKSQGLTFDKAIIDAGASFAPGQVYVALSRLTSLKNLILHSQLTPQNILTDENVLAFTSREQTADILEDTLAEAQRDYLHQALLETFDWKRLLEKTDQFIHDTAGRRIPDKPAEMAWLNTLKGNLLKQNEVAEKFKTQLEKLLSLPDKSVLQDRSVKAINWFSAALEKEVIDYVEEHIKKSKSNAKTKKYLNNLRDLLVAFSRKAERIKQAAVVTTAFSGSRGMEAVMDSVTILQRPLTENNLVNVPPPKPAKGETFRITLELFREGMSIEEIAVTRKLKRSTIENHLLKFIPTGEVEINDLVSPRKQESILEVLETHAHATPGEISRQLGNEISYAEIRAVILSVQQKKNKQKV